MTPYQGKSSQPVRDTDRGGVFRAVRLLEARLACPPSVQELASEAGLSLTEFQEAFRNIVGEPVTQHIARLRVEWAASLLKCSDIEPQEIGRTCGFSTQAGFSVAFKDCYGVTPQVFRTQEQRGLAGVKRSKKKIGKVTVQDWPEVQFICLRAYLSLTEINKPWIELMAWARQQQMDLNRAHFYGLWFDDWAGTTTTSYRYESALLLPPNSPTTPPAPFFVRTLEAGQVAVCQTRGNLYTLDRAWHAFAMGWLPTSGFQLRGSFALDGYSNRLIQSHALKKIVLAALGGMSVAMCLPVQAIETDRN